MVRTIGEITAGLEPSGHHRAQILCLVLTAVSELPCPIDSRLGFMRCFVTEVSSGGNPYCYSNMLFVQAWRPALTKPPHHGDHLGTEMCIIHSTYIVEILSIYFIGLITIWKCLLASFLPSFLPPSTVSSLSFRKLTELKDGYMTYLKSHRRRHL